MKTRITELRAMDNRDLDHELLHNPTDRSRVTSVVLERAAKRGARGWYDHGYRDGFDDGVRDCLGRQAPCRCRLTAPAQPTEVARAVPPSTAATKAILRAARTAPDVSAACRALLDSGWDLRDPRGLMDKSPDEVRNYLESHTAGFASSWSELGATPSRLNLLRMIIDAYFRAYPDGEES